MEWMESLLNVYGKLRLAREAKDLDDNQKLLATSREVVRAHHRRHLGADFREDGDEEAMIHIGDQHQHYQAAPAGGSLGPLLKLATAAGLLATGVGGGLAVPLLMDALRPHPTPPVVAPPSDDSTLYDLRLGPPE